MLRLGNVNGFCMVMGIPTFPKKHVAGAIILNRQHVPILVIKGYREMRSARVAHDVIAGLIRFGGKLLCRKVFY